MSEQLFNISPGQWASKGSEPLYDWFASTNYYSKTLWGESEYSKTCNNQVNSCRTHLGKYREILLQQLKEEPLFNNHSKIRVLNTEVISISNTQTEMNNCIRQYFGDYNQIIDGNSIRTNGLSGKILIMPFVYRDPRGFRFLTDVIPILKSPRCGITKAIVLFACNLVPKNGRFIECKDFPYISDNSFIQEISFEDFRGILNLVNDTPPQETFRRRSTPMNLKGTEWKSEDNKVSIQFDKHSVNGSTYNGEFALYDYDTESAILSFVMMDEFSMGQTLNFHVNSITPDIMDITGRNGRLILQRIH